MLTTLDWSSAPAKFPWIWSKYKPSEIGHHPRNSKKLEVSSGLPISTDTLLKTFPRYAGRFTTSPRRMCPLYGAPLNRPLSKHSKPPSLPNPFWPSRARTVPRGSKSISQDMPPVESSHRSAMILTPSGIRSSSDLRSSKKPSATTRSGIMRCLRSPRLSWNTAYTLYFIPIFPYFYSFY
jgi:hypothetical protein